LTTGSQGQRQQKENTKKKTKRKEIFSFQVIGADISCRKRSSLGERERELFDERWLSSSSKPDQTKILVSSFTPPFGFLLYLFFARSNSGFSHNFQVNLHARIID
jgi:hypothetical protein